MNAVLLEIPVTRHVRIVPIFTQVAGQNTLFGRHNAYGVKLAVNR